MILIMNKSPKQHIKTVYQEVESKFVFHKQTTFKLMKLVEIYKETPL